MPKYRLIIFDFDGTLADSADWMIRTLNEVGQQFGIRSVTADEVEMLRGRSSREIIGYLAVPPWKLPGIAAAMRRRVAADVASIPLFAGVSEMLQRLRAAQVRTAIVSSNSEDNIRGILGPANAALIDDYECGASLFGKARKLRTVLAHTATQAADALCVGDETRDIEAAREAGIASGAVLWGYAKPEILIQFRPSVTFATMSDIAALAE